MFYLLPLLATIAWPAGPAQGALLLDNIKVYGYFDLGYFQTTGPKFAGGGPDDPDMENGAFDLRHFNILTDITVRQNLFVKMHIEFEHGINPSSEEASLVMEYGFAEYVVKDALKLRAGKMLTPIGIFGEIHDATPAYLSVSPPETFYRPFRKGGVMLAPKWNTGLMLMGTLAVTPDAPELEYALYVGNGESRITTNEAENDDNPNKALGFRLQLITAGDILNVGVSGYKGDKAQDKTHMRLPHTSLSGHISANFKGFNIMAEYGRSDLNGEIETTWYVQTSLRIGAVTPYFRYQSLNPNQKILDDSWVIWVGGVNIILTDGVYLKLEWDENRRGRGNEYLITGEDKDFGEFQSSLTMMF